MSKVLRVIQQKRLDQRAAKRAVKRDEKRRLAEELKAEVRYSHLVSLLVLIFVQLRVISYSSNIIMRMLPRPTRRHVILLVHIQSTSPMQLLHI